MEEFLEGYTRCAVAAGTPADTFQFNLGTLAGLVPGVLSNPHKASGDFELFHRAMREPLDMYQWGNSFFAPMIEFDNSHLEGLENLEQIKGMLERGENVFLLANHQTEADPQVISLLLERAGYGCVAEKVINVAGHRVTTDPMAVPFSMGRNLFCIYSKKYMENPPEDKPAKQNHNMRTLKKMAELLAQPEGQIIWVAPSGGRDRPDPATGDFVVAPFDPKSVGVFRLMAAKTRKVCKTHFFPFAMWTNKLMPPPDTVQKDLGERRVAERGPVSIAVCNEVDGEGLDMQQFAAAVEASVKAGYAKLDAQQKAQAK
ncbi:glycerol-3-phosphate acyltransferase,chloroplastic, partial [Tribonema minus]